MLDRCWQARGWNEEAERLFAGWLDRAAADRNLLRFIFLAPSARALIPDWEDRARRVAAEFRAASSANLDDPEILGLVAGLRRRPALPASGTSTASSPARAAPALLPPSARGLPPLRAGEPFPLLHPDLTLTILVED